MDVQDFILRFSGTQTYIRANYIYKKENARWKSFFQRICIDYFGDNFVEYNVLKQALEVELADECEAWVRRHLY